MVRWQLESSWRPDAATPRSTRDAEQPNGSGPTLRIARRRTPGRAHAERDAAAAHRSANVATLGCHGSESLKQVVQNSAERRLHSCETPRRGYIAPTVLRPQSTSAARRASATNESPARPIAGAQSCPGRGFRSAVAARLRTGPSRTCGQRERYAIATLTLSRLLQHGLPPGSGHRTSAVIRSDLSSRRWDQGHVMWMWCSSHALMAPRTRSTVP